MDYQKYSHQPETIPSLFDPRIEKSACGVGFVVNIRGESSPSLLRMAETMSHRMEHRGACSCDNLTGDGAGVMTSIPHELFVSRVETESGGQVTLPSVGSYATGLIFLDESSISSAQLMFERLAVRIGLKVIWWSSPPTDSSSLGSLAKSTQPIIKQVFIIESNDEPVLNGDEPSASGASCSDANMNDMPDGPIDDLNPDVTKTFHDSQEMTFEHKIFFLRKWSTHELLKAGLRFYVCSLSSKVIVYKGQFTPPQLWSFYDDLKDVNFSCYLALVHARFSTNTFPSWDRAQPLRLLAHNGEINTLRGNVNLMSAREGVMESRIFGDDLSKLYPVVEPDSSDSGSVDNVLEFLYRAGSDRSLPESVITMVPESFDPVDVSKLTPTPSPIKDEVGRAEFEISDSSLDSLKQSFYQFSATSTEPWDGPALLTFSDGRFVGAILDRNGLRPSRYVQTKSGLVAMASEVGVTDFPHEEIIHKGRLRPGRILLIDTQTGILARDSELKREIFSRQPYFKWLREGLMAMDHLIGDVTDALEDDYSHDSSVGPSELDSPLSDARLTLFGYSIETIEQLLKPMVAVDGEKKEALGSMGNDVALACVSQSQPLVYEYFKQVFAQVTNPPIDPFREKIVMSLACPVGPESNLLMPSPDQCRRLWLTQPIISNNQMRRLKKLSSPDVGSSAVWRSKVISCLLPIPDITTSGNAPDATYLSQLGSNMRNALAKICSEAEEAASPSGNIQILILSDRYDPNDDSHLKLAPIPALISLGCVHQHLIRQRLRMRVALFVETGEAREIHHLCCLLGYGADAINPYLVFESMSRILSQPQDVIFNNYVKAAETGICKVMAKMGISTLQSYKGAQIFEAVGLGSEVIETSFKNTASRIGGTNFDIISLEVIQRHFLAYNSTAQADKLILRNPGFLHWRSGGEKHVNEPRAVALLQEASSTNSPKAYEDYVKWSRQAIRETTLRGQLQLVYPENGGIDLDSVETSVEEILRRFCTGAMSFGSISIEAHEALAKAMNKIGGKSNTGEGGENEERLHNPETRSSIKQVASGRFGVTAAYLANADELQIKMAQGAKPGEGGELPGHKVTVEIAATRKSVPGVGLISPPPHHDIYSIEDLAQLIYDLKCSNPKARISVKLVSVVGVGIVASGVAKGKAEHITISGHDGGTGASSWTGIKGAGIPWELGLSETHQVLVANDLRSRVVLQVDGQIRTAFDVIVAAALGADEFAMSTGPLIVLGCTMMRKCHLNTCPVGVATQDPILRKKFAGQPEHVVNYFFLLAHEIRSEMAKLGIRRFEELIGKTDVLNFDPVNQKAAKLDFAAILCDASKLLSSSASSVDMMHVNDKLPQNFGLEKRRDNFLIETSKEAGLISIPDEDKKSILNSPESSLINAGKVLEISTDISNVDRTFGTTLSYEIVSFWGEAGLPPSLGTIEISAKGSAGQSFGAWICSGIKIILEGDANDYVGKGLSGGQLTLYPPKVLTDNVIDGHLFRSENNVIAGNVALYGATSGKSFFRGILGERFAVRNSGAKSVNEGVGDHSCEYMTGGVVVILGNTGRNFGAGMSGGIAYVFCYEWNVPEQKIDWNSIRGDDELIKIESDRRKRIFVRKSNLASIDLVDLSDGNVWSIDSSTKKCITLKSPEDLILENDESDLKSLIQEFVDETGSTIGSEILNDWELRRRFFIKVFPKEYQKVLLKPKPVVIETPVVTKTEPNVKDIEDLLGQNLDKTRGFMKYPRIKGYYRDASERSKDWEEVYDVQKIKDNVRVQATRCMDCGIPFCQSPATGCPLGNLIPTWNNHVHLGDMSSATLSLLQTNNFPEFTGRVCPAPCEGSCVLGINSDPVAIKSVELSISEYGFESGLISKTVLSKTASSPKTGRSVAVIGAGPAGLAVAAQLALVGHSVTVYDRQPLPGGLLQYGIPSMKLNKEIIARRIGLMKQQGIQFVSGVDVGRNPDETRQMMSGFDAISICVGATWPRDLKIDNRDADGIFFAMEYLGDKRTGLKRNAHETISAKGKKVVVIGGGDTGCDCIGTALREGAESVVSFEILDRPPATRDGVSNPWPQWPKIFRTDYGHEEVKDKSLNPVEPGSDPRIYAVSSKEFLVREDPDSGRKVVTGVKTVSIRWEKTDSGGYKMIEVPDSERVFEADLILLALGFLGPESYLASALNIPVDARSNNIITQRQPGLNGCQSNGVSYYVGANVFASGDCRRGQSLVVHAINEGRQAARAIDLFLKSGGETSHKQMVNGSGDQVDSSGAIEKAAVNQLLGSALATSGGLVMPPEVQA